MSNLATIQRIKNIRKHPNADTLSIANILGWQIIFNHEKDPYKENDLVVYVVIDTVLPEKPEFEFLRSKNFRIKPIRLRQEESAGICFPLSILGDKVAKKPCTDLSPDGPFFYLVNEGDDVTEILDITHYEKPMPAQLAGQAVGGFPGFLIITDELNLRTYPDAIPEMWSRPYYITRKDDGCLDENTMINTDDGLKTIKEICDTKYNGHVLSYDVEANRVQYSKITNWYINNTSDNWYEIETESGEIIKITGNHRVWLPELQCYRSVEDLTENDKFLIES